MDFGFRTNALDGISPKLIDGIIDVSVDVEVTKAGGNNKCKIVEYNGTRYAVLKTTNIECYSFPTTRSANRAKTPEQILADGDLNFDEVMRIGASLKAHHVVPILGFSWDVEKISKYHSPDSENKSAYARGFIVQPVAPGRELYDGLGYVDGTNPDRVQRLVDYTAEYSAIPASHFATFAQDYMAISKHLMIDPSKRGNFFYDKEQGFSFIDLNFHAKQDYTEQELAQMSARYIAMQFRPVWSGTFELFSPEQQAAYAQGTKDIFCKMIQGFERAGISQPIIEEAIDSMVSESTVFESVGIQSTAELMAEAKKQTEITNTKTEEAAQ